MCSFPACNRPIRSKGLCNTHYHQQRRSGEMWPIDSPRSQGRRAPRPCAHEGCERPSRSHGYCNTHRGQFRKYGETWDAGTNAGKRGHFCREPGCSARTTYVFCEVHRPLRVPTCEAAGCDELRRGASIFCDRHARKDRWYRHKYGVSQRQVDEMTARQNGRCGICRETLALHVDHDHETGVVRGLLCGNCNRAIGLLAHDPSRMRAAIAYLGS